MENECCPVSLRKVSEIGSRFIGAFTLILAALFMFSGNYFFLVLLFLDFIFRVQLNPFSLISPVVKFFISKLKIKDKKVDSAPKRFAAFIGLFMTAFILFFYFFGFLFLANIFALILCVCAALECGLSICVGCKVYTVLNNYILKR